MRVVRLKLSPSHLFVPPLPSMTIHENNVQRKFEIKGCGSLQLPLASSKGSKSDKIEVKLKRKLEKERKKRTRFARSKSAYKGS